MYYYVCVYVCVDVCVISMLAIFYKVMTSLKVCLRKERNKQSCYREGREGFIVCFLYQSYNSYDSLYGHLMSITNN